LFETSYKYWDKTIETKRLENLRDFKFK